MSRRFAGRGLVAGLLAGVLFAGVVPQVVALAASEPTVASLTVHKHVKTSSNGKAPGDGTASVQDAKPIGGVEFKVEKVEGVDLSSNEGWVKANEIVKHSRDAKELKPGYSFAQGSSKTTNGQGLAVFNDLPLGLYRVTETRAPLNVQKAGAFWVTLPMLDPVNAGGFNYDVHVYPKNTEHSIVKSVKDDVVKSWGDSLLYTVEVPLSAQRPDSVKLEDTLDSRLVYQNASLKIGEHALSEGADYSLSHDNGKVSVSLTSAGIDKFVQFANSEPLSKLVLLIGAQVNGSGVIPNQAVLFVNDSEVRVESNRVESKLGAVKVSKTDLDTGKGLDGVEFKIYAGSSSDFAQARSISVNGKDTFVTANGGKLEVDGLRYSGFANNKQVHDGEDEFLHYWLVETKPLAGYNALVKPIHFLVDQPLQSAVTIEVKNTKPTPLPLTGSFGAGLLVGSGLLLMFGSAAWYVRSRREI